MVEAELNPSKFGWELLSRIDLKNQLNPSVLLWSEFLLLI